MSVASTIFAENENVILKPLYLLYLIARWAGAVYQYAVAQQLRGRALGGDASSRRCLL